MITVEMTETEAAVFIAMLERASEEYGSQRTEQLTAFYSSVLG